MTWFHQALQLPEPAVGSPSSNSAPRLFFAGDVWHTFEQYKWGWLHWSMHTETVESGGGFYSRRWLLTRRSRDSGYIYTGDYMASGWNGFMDGAIESGLKCARNIIDLHRKHQWSFLIYYVDGCRHWIRSQMWAKSIDVIMFQKASKEIQWFK